MASSKFTFLEIHVETEVASTAKNSQFGGVVEQPGGVKVPLAAAGAGHVADAAHLGEGGPSKAKDALTAGVAATSTTSAPGPNGASVQRHSVTDSWYCWPGPRAASASGAAAAGGPAAISRPRRLAAGQETATDLQEGKGRCKACAGDAARAARRARGRRS